MESNIDILTRTQAPLFYFYGLVLYGDSFIVMQRLLNEKKDEKRPGRSLYRCRLLRHLYVLPTIRFVHQLERNHQTIERKSLEKRPQSCKMRKVIRTS